jgi:O-antigen/teichoic acid export membrane protein
VSTVANPSAAKHPFGAASSLAARGAVPRISAADESRVVADAIEAPCLDSPNPPVVPATAQGLVARATLLDRIGRVFAGRGFWALSDQAVLSLGNFLTSYLLYNFLPSHAQFAVYTLILGSVFFLNTLHASLVSYPLSMKGAATDEEGLRPLTRRCAKLTGVLLIPLGLILVAAVCVLGQPGLIPWALAALVLWQLQETMRRAMMSQLKHRRAVPGDAVSYLGQAALIGGLAAAGMLTLKSALVAVAVTSGAAALLQAMQLGLLRLPESKPSNDVSLPLSKLAAEHWSYGRWLVAINFISIITIQAMPWTLKFMRGAQGDTDVAHFQALAALLGVSNPIVISVVGLIVPAVAIAYRSGGMAGSRKVTLEYGLLGAVLLLPYFALLAIFPEVVLRIYTHGQHETSEALPAALRLFVAAYALTYPTQVVTALLNGLGHSRSALVAQIAFAVATLAVTLPLAAKFGLVGACWGGLLPPLAYGAVSVWLVRRTRAAILPDAEGEALEVVSSRAGAAGTLLPEGTGQ